MRKYFWAQFETFQEESYKYLCSILLYFPASHGNHNNSFDEFDFTRWEST